MRQETLTVVARVEDPEELSDLLAGLSSGMFASAELGIHFARIALIPGDRANGHSPWVVLESNFDSAEDDPGRAREEQLALLAAEVPGLADVFKPCGFRDSGAEALAAFLARHMLPATAAYQGHTGRDLLRIRVEQRLRDVILEYMETAPVASHTELFRRAREHVLASQDPLLSNLGLDGPSPGIPDPILRKQKLRERIWPWIQNAWTTLPILARLPLTLAWQEADKTFDQRAQQEGWTYVQKQNFIDIAATEDLGLQNALTHVVPLRSGWGRLDVLRSAHAYIDVMARKYFGDIGQLGGIPSIHFAKWLLIDGGGRLLFLSNYDQSWESYLGDFVDQAALGLNLAWCCTQEYPRTELLAFEGASDEATFKAWGRAWQVPTQVFYSAYPELSIAAINNNSLIRDRLHKTPDGDDLEAWFRRLT